MHTTWKIPESVGLLKETMVVKCLHVGNYCAFKGLECFQTEMFQIFYFSTDNLFDVQFNIYVYKELYPTNVSDPVFSSHSWINSGDAFLLLNISIKMLCLNGTQLLPPIYLVWCKLLQFNFLVQLSSVFVHDVLEGVVHLTPHMGGLHLGRIYVESRVIM